MLYIYIYITHAHERKEVKRRLVTRREIHYNDRKLPLNRSVATPIVSNSLDNANI